MKKLILYLLVLFAAFAILGFSREFIFVNINNQLYNLYYGYNDAPIPASLHFITAYSYETLYYAKYPLTILYAVLYFLTTYLAVRYMTADKKFGRWAVYIYALLLILSGIVMAWGYFVNHRLDNEEYSFSRWVMGIAQSPLVAFFLLASSGLYTHLNTTKQSPYEKRDRDL
ncbi:MAG: hypothetical protein JST26_06230 [Bacteroidetes bacterium]|nr:hypothetical protein [Bacteroidota bacterium]